MRRCGGLLRKIAEGQQKRIIAQRQVEEPAVAFAVVLHHRFRNGVDRPLQQIDQLRLAGQRTAFDGDGRFIGGRQDFSRHPVDERRAAVRFGKAAAEQTPARILPASQQRRIDRPHADRELPYGELLPEDRRQHLQCPVRRFRLVLSGRDAVRIELRAQHAEIAVVQITCLVPHGSIQRLDHIHAGEIGVELHPLEHVGEQVAGEELRLPHRGPGHSAKRSGPVTAGLGAGLPLGELHRRILPQAESFYRPHALD